MNEHGCQDDPGGKYASNGDRLEMLRARDTDIIRLIGERDEARRIVDRTAEAFGWAKTYDPSMIDMHAAFLRAENERLRAALQKVTERAVCCQYWDGVVTFCTCARCIARDALAQPHGDRCGCTDCCSERAALRGEEGT